MLTVIKLYIAVRLLLAAINVHLWEVLDSFVELSTPVSSFMRLSEGIYLYKNLDISPYDGGPFHQSPLILSLFSFVPNALAFLVFIIADVLAAYSLAYFASKKLKASFSVEVVAALYLFNPFCFLSNLAQSTNVLTNALICGAIGSTAVSTNGSKTMIYLALASALSWYPCYLVPPFIGLVKQHIPMAHSSAKLIAVYVISTITCLCLSFIPDLSWSFLESQFGTLLLLKDLTRPNIGLWWYFFIEQFEFFRPFFLGAFQLMVLAFTAPLTIRFPDQPLYVITCLTGVFSVLKPYPEASDFGLFLSLLVLNKEIFDLLEYRPFEVLGICYVTALSPTFYYLWIYVGSGNANFFYAITLVYTVTVVVLLGDATWAAIRISYDGGKATNLTQI